VSDVGYQRHQANTKRKENMAISNNLLLKELSGQIGKQLVFKQYGNKTVVSNYPDMSRRVLSPAQLQVNETMVEANYEARKIIADEGLRNAAQVRLNVKRKKLYTALIKEYFKNVREAKEISG
jgi:hypothetical protein